MKISTAEFAAKRGLKDSGNLSCRPPQPQRPAPKGKNKHSSSLSVSRFLSICLTNPVLVRVESKGSLSRASATSHRDFLPDTAPENPAMFSTPGTVLVLLVATLLAEHNCAAINLCELPCAGDIYSRSCGGAICITGVSQSSEFSDLCSKTCEEGLSSLEMLECFSTTETTLVIDWPQVQDFFVKEVQTFCDRGNPFEEAKDEEGAMAPALAPSSAPSETPTLEILDDANQEPTARLQEPRPVPRSANTTEAPALPRKIGMRDKSSNPKRDANAVSKNSRAPRVKQTSTTKLNATMDAQPSG